MRHFSVTIPPEPAFIHALSMLKTLDIPCEWQESRNICLPLRPIGRLSDLSILEEIDDALSRLRWSGFSCMVKEITFQDRKEDYRLGLTMTASPELSSLHQKVSYALHRTGLPMPRKRFIPFIELGRVNAGQEKALENWLQRCALFDLPSFTVDHLSLIETFSARSYGQYVVLENYGPNIEANVRDYSAQFKM